MRKVFTLCAAVLFAGAMSAEVITMDLSTAKNVKGDAIKYETKATAVTYYNNLKDVMDSTYSPLDEYAKIVTNDGAIKLDHLPTGDSYGGTSWEGFTLSKVASDSVGNQFGCAAKGGVAGVGTPFVVGYYSEYASWAILDYSSCHVGFKGEYYPEEVMICQDALTLENLRNGLGYAHAFTATDTLTLEIYAADEDGFDIDDVEPVVFKLAEGTTFNTAWTKVDLKALGKCYGLNFVMKTTDVYGGFSNTALYFCMDKLAINSENPVTAIEAVKQSAVSSQKVIRNGQVLIIRGENVYNILGSEVK